MDPKLQEEERTRKKKGKKVTNYNTKGIPFH